MSEPKIFWYERGELNDPIAIVGFPSIGLVGSIITSYIARTLSMKVVAGATPTDTQQYTLIQNGTPYPPVRIYAGPIPKKRKKKVKPAEGAETEMPPEKKEAPRKRVKARDLIVLTSELAPRPEQTYDFTVAMFDIVKEMGCSRRLATLRFRQTTGRSILKEIHTQRLARICDLLANTSWPISTVIAQSGYVSESFAQKLFRSHTGLTMRAWRMRSHAPIP